MKSETGIITVLGKYSVYFEHHKKDGAAKTAIMVNGALATTTSFSQSIRNLRDHVNIVLFDLPFAGRSREHNTSSSVLTKDDEVEILLYLIERFSVNYMISASWGGVSALLSLARRPPTIEKAVILSFSPVINSAMHSYMVHGSPFLVRPGYPWRSGAAQQHGRKVSSPPAQSSQLSIFAVDDSRQRAADRIPYRPDI